MRIATGEEPEDYAGAQNDRAASWGRAGGKKRAERLTKEQRSSESAKKAAKARWEVRAAPSEEE
jgi:hypothetical protein